MWRIPKCFQLCAELCLGSKVSLMLEKCHLSYSLLWFKSPYDRHPTVPNVILCRRNTFFLSVKTEWKS